MRAEVTRSCSMLTHSCYHQTMQQPLAAWIVIRAVLHVCTCRGVPRVSYRLLNLSSARAVTASSSIRARSRIHRKTKPSVRSKTLSMLHNGNRLLNSDTHAHTYTNTESHPETCTHINTHIHSYTHIRTHRRMHTGLGLGYTHIHTHRRTRVHTFSLFHTRVFVGCGDSAQVWT